jgi:hypothetical protein
MEAITRRSVLTLAAGAAVIFAADRSAAAGANTVVAELFTSQGCSSCPPADRLLGELRTMSGVIALTYNVDYWDYLGWRDTLASPEKSQRQYNYAKARGDMDVYTPQIIVDGGSHYNGANRSVVLAAIDRATAAGPRHRPALSFTADEREFLVEIGNDDHEVDATLWLMAFASSVAVKIAKGENAGKEIVYYNVVRRMVPAAMWRGRAMKFSLPKRDILADDCRGAAALLQRGKAGPLLAASAWGEAGG